MGPHDEVWQLHHGDRVVAALHVTEADFPWLRARVEPAPGFDTLAPLLAEEARLADALDDGVSAEWEAAHDRVRAVTRLTRPDGRDVPEYLLHVDGSEAWWRCSDEPVDAAAPSEAGPGAGAAGGTDGSRSEAPPPGGGTLQEEPSREQPRGVGPRR